LQQLELSAEENRYETQRSATAPEENQAQRESREILNRLKDLARRQDDLNERLRELQSALQQAESRQRREELERELKRLRDQQQEILRDTDELMSRMDQAQNQQAVQDSREQMEQGRSHVQQASEALEQGQLSQALTEGTRAGRQLSEVRDQFRQQAANRFSEEMTEMRREARNLDQEQERLSQQLTEQNNEAGRSLRGTGSRAEAQEGIAEQRRDLGELQEQMQRTIEEAEQPEPLLARQLYDTLRETHQQRVDDALNVTRRLLDVGIEREAGEAMRTASQGIRNLRQGVERCGGSG
jgi:chromosome segregation ATPase